MLQKNEGRILNFLRAYVEAIKIFKTEPEYTLKALAQFSRVNDQELLREAYEYNKNKIPVKSTGSYLRNLLIRRDKITE